MKKIHYISALLLTVLVGASSCSREEDDIFDSSAADRLENMKAEYSDILTKDGGKWVFNYFANSNEHGYTFVLDFDKNGSVNVSSKNVYNSSDGGSSVFKSQTSLWQVIADNGPVLTFNTHNELLHVFSGPYDDPTTGEVDETGRGHEGDYEFMILGVSGDTLKLKGKKHGLDLNMIRVADDTDAQSFFTGIDNLTNKIFSTKFPEIIFEAENGERYTVTNMASQIFAFVPEGGDAITETIKACGMITRDGVYFLSPFKGAKGEFAAQNFVLQPDGTLLCTNDNKSRFFGHDYSYLMSDNKTYLWRIDAKSVTGAFADSYNTLSEDLKDYNGSTIQYVNFTYDTKLESNVVEIRVKLKSNKYLSCIFKNNYDVVSPTEIKMNINTTDIDTNTKSLYNNVASMNSFLNMLSNGNITLSSECQICPKTMTMTLGSNGTANVDIK